MCKVRGPDTNLGALPHRQNQSLADLTFENAIVFFSLGFCKANRLLIGLCDLESRGKSGQIVCVYILRNFLISKLTKRKVLSISLCLQVFVGAVQTVKGFL